MIDVAEILEHWYAGRPKMAVATSLGVDRKTISKYTAPAIAAGYAPGGPPVTHETWELLARQWFPELMVPELSSPCFVECNAHHEAIKAGLATNTLATVHQRLRDEAGLVASETTLRRYVAIALPEHGEQRVTVLRDDPPPGAEGQVDYGKLGMWLDPVSERRRSLWAFVMVLCCSRHMFVRPTLVMDQAEWVIAHVEAAEFFGGLPRRLVIDNLKTGVDRPDLYDPKINRSYAELANHYGVLIDPARAAKPKDKPRVERPMQYVRDSFFAGRNYETITAWREKALVWCTDVAGNRTCRPIDGARPGQLFAAIEQEALVPLPQRPFDLATWSSAKVHPDCHVKVAKTLYSVPWRHVGEQVDVRSTPTTVAIYSRGELIKTHIPAEKGRRTDNSDYPPDKIAFFSRTPVWCRNKAAEIGPACAAVIGDLLEIEVLTNLRSAQAILSLAERNEPTSVEAACNKAQRVGDPTYRTIKGILGAGTEADVDEDDTGTDTPAFLHGAAMIAGAQS